MFIYAGASPFTQDNELAGSRNEFIHYLQKFVFSRRRRFGALNLRVSFFSASIPDQPAIVRQYMRHTAEIRTGKNGQFPSARCVALSLTRRPICSPTGRSSRTPVCQE